VEGIAGHVIQGVLSRDIVHPPADDDGELDFPVDFVSAFGNHERVVGADQCGGGLKENHRLEGNLCTGFGGVVAEIQPDADDLAGTANGWSQARLRAHHGG